MFFIMWIFAGGGGLGAHRLLPLLYPNLGVVWVEFVTTSIILVTTSKKYGYRRHWGRYTERA